MELTAEKKDELLQVVKQSLLTGFFDSFSSLQWESLTGERDNMLLTVCMLISFFSKQGLLQDDHSKDRVLAYLMDQLLCGHVMRITDFDVQRMMLKKEAR